MATIRAKHYDVDEARLAEDPLVITMANEIPVAVISQWLHGDGQPTSDFMMRANREYRNRGGKDGAHIGCIAHAILKIRGM